MISSAVAGCKWLSTLERHGARAVAHLERYVRDPADKWTLGPCVRFAIKVVCVSQALLQRLVLSGNIRMSSQIIAEADGSMPLRGAHRDEVKVMGSRAKAS
jgi:hypothetical protein